MNRLAIFVLICSALPGIVYAQESKPVSCRSLEAAGNFVGPDEYLDGDRVCKKTKSGDLSKAKPEPAKTTLDPAPVSIADAARANAAAKAAAKKSEVDKDVDKDKVDSAVRREPVENTSPAATEPRTDSAKAASLASAPVQEAAPAPTPPSSAPAAPASNAASAEPARPPRIHRDAPVSPGTPSEPPEIDHGFSDANAVEPPRAGSSPKADTSGQPAGLATGHDVKTGAFDPSESASASGTAVPIAGVTECAKNITLGTLSNGKLTVGVPSWAEKWMEQNQGRLEKTCFSPTPRKGARNYLVVFYGAPGNGQGASASMPLPDATSGAGAFTAKNGETWQYSGPTEGAASLARDDASWQVWYATAYTQDGTPVAEQWPDPAKRQSQAHAAEDLLASVVEDLRRL